MFCIYENTGCPIYSIIYSTVPASSPEVIFDRLQQGFTSWMQLYCGLVLLG